MHAVYFSIVMLSLASLCFADARYVTTITSTGPGGGTPTKHFVKGNKMKVDLGNTVSITDFDKQTLTVINHSTKSYSLTPFAQTAAAVDKSGMEMKAAFKDTGLTKKIAGFNCRQIIMTMIMSGQSVQGAPPMQMSMENETWVSNEVPGAPELKAITAKMAERGIVSGGANPQMSRMMTDMLKQLVKAGGGVPVLQITRLKGGDDPRSKQLEAKMQEMKTQMEAMKKKGAPQSDAMEKTLAMMGAASGGKYLMEMTSESSGFSTAVIPASEFDIPAGYKKADR